MKQLAKSFLCLSLLLAISAMSVRAASCDNCSEFSFASCDVSDCVSTSSSTCGNCPSVYIPRSTLYNTAYFWFPWRKDIDCEMNGIVEVGFEYQRSFNGKKIAQSLFGGSDTLHFQGSGITGSTRDPRALIADNFGLSSLCDTTVAFKPRIQNYNLNFHGRLGLDNWVEGLYGEVFFAFTHQNRHLDLRTSSTLVSGASCVASNASCGVSNASCGVSNTCSENNCSVGTISSLCNVSSSTACSTPFAAGYMGAASVATVPSVVAALGGQSLFGDMQTPWAFGQFPTCSRSKNAVAGVALVAGWNFYQSDCGHFGAFFQYMAPTGNNPDPRFLFSPVVGDGKHHQLGGGISAHYELWNNDCDQSLNVYLDGYVMSALRNNQLRSFDFAGKGCLSRYMLLEKISPTTSAYVGASGLIDGINFATRWARVKISVLGDASLRFVYSNGGFNFGLGYNAYGKSREDLYLINNIVNDCNGDPVLDSTVNYGFKGCASLYTAGVANAPAITQSTATITTCGVNDSPTPVIIQNPVAQGLASCGAASTSCGSASSASVSCNNSVASCPASNNCASDCSFSVSASGSAVSNAVSTGVLNLCSGEAPKQFTNKGFAHIDYTWAECDYAPYLGIGAEAEGGSHQSLSQWGVWIKGGIQF